jgi:hypothetical protein
LGYHACRYSVYYADNDKNNDYVNPEILSVGAVPEVQNVVNPTEDGRHKNSFQKSLR